MIQGGVRSNIIPEEVQLTGTIRTLDTAMQRDIHERMHRTVTKIAESAGATAEIAIDKKTLITFNDPALVQKTLPSLQKAAGTANVQLMDAMTGAEDFYIDESGFKLGVKAFCNLVLDYGTR